MPLNNCGSTFFLHLDLNKCSETEGCQNLSLKAITFHCFAQSANIYDTDKIRNPFHSFQFSMKNSQLHLKRTILNIFIAFAIYLTLYRASEILKQIVFRGNSLATGTRIETILCSHLMDVFRLLRHFGDGWLFSVVVLVESLERDFLNPVPHIWCLIEKNSQEFQKNLDVRAIW